LTTFRGDPDGDIIKEINDPKNGFLITSSLHILVGNGMSAFIQVRFYINAFSRTITFILPSKTPNLGLTRGDIPPSPNVVPGVHTERLTLQHFHDPSPQTNDRAAQNQDARLPETLENWPPILITNFVYGCAVVKRWGKTGSVDTLRKLARETYYNQRPQAQIAKQAEDDHHSEQKSVRAARLDNRNKDKGAGAGEEEQKKHMDIMDILMFLRHKSVSEAPPIQLGASLEEASTTKVQAWLRAQ
jgi:hypothetical protein